MEKTANQIQKERTRELENKANALIKNVMSQRLFL